MNPSRGDHGLGSASPSSTPVVVPRVLPDGPAPPSGWRCGGDGRERVCEDRNRNASSFDCGTQRCLQARPRMPDDGEWECVEISGVVFCHSRVDGAGMQAGPIDLGWLSSYVLIAAAALNPARL